MLHTHITPSQPSTGGGPGVPPFQPHPSYHPHPGHFRQNSFPSHVHPYGAPPPYGSVPPQMSSPYGHPHLSQSNLVSPGGSSILRSTNTWAGRQEANSSHPPSNYGPQQGGGPYPPGPGGDGYGRSSYQYGSDGRNGGPMNRSSPREPLTQNTQNRTTSPSNEQGFVRAVSSSFGNHSRAQRRSSGSDKISPFQRDATDDMSLHSSADSDRSWKQLNQVASIEEERLRREEEMENASLTSIGTNKSFQDKLTPSKLSSLNSLSSVASIQEPIDTSGTKGGNNLDFSGPDLLQCESGSSGSLLFNGQDELLTKRSREERGDIDIGRGGCDDEIRGAASTESPPNVAELSMKEKDESRPLKKRRENSNFDDYDQVPNYTFSIDSVPSFSNKDGDKQGRNGDHESLNPLETLDKGEGKGKNDSQRTLRSSMPSWDLPGTGSFGDNLTLGSNKSGGVEGSHSMLSSSFSFENHDLRDKKKKTKSSGGKDVFDANNSNASMSSAPNLTETRNQSFEYQNRDGIVPTRTESSDLSYLGGVPHQIYSQPPNGRSRSPMRQFPPGIPPWARGVRDPTEAGKHQLHHPRHPGGPGAIGGPYHPLHTGSFGSSGSPHGPPRQSPMGMNRSENSTPTGPGLQRGYPPPHNNESFGRAPSHGGPERHLPHAFRPPPPNLSGHARHMNRHQQPAVYLMTSSPGSGTGVHRTGSNLSKNGPGGVYCWTKEDDARLTEIMKKYKNPKDWGPIAKEFGGNKRYDDKISMWKSYVLTLDLHLFGPL